MINASGLLKTFLRSIEEPLFTNRLYPRVVEISGKRGFFKTLILELNEIDRVSAIRELVETLPKSNYDLLRVIIEFLTQVISIIGGLNLSFKGFLAFGQEPYESE